MHLGSFLKGFFVCGLVVAASSCSSPAHAHHLSVVPGGGQWRGVAGGKGGGVSCAGSGSAAASVLDPQSSYCTGYCTYWVWEKRYQADPSEAVADLRNLGNAIDWKTVAEARHIPVGTLPVVGAIAWWGKEVPGGEGHVAYVISATSTTVTYSEMNAHAGWNRVDTWTSVLGQKGAPDGYIYGGPAAGAEYIGHIVQWSADTKAQKTAWLVIDDNGHARRNWIPSIAIFYCLQGRGASGPYGLAASILSSELPDEPGVWASCGGVGGGAAPSSAPQPPTSKPAARASSSQPPAPQPTSQQPTSSPAKSAPPQTWTEQEGHYGANTFVDPYNASGQDSRISAGAYVQVSCKVYAPQIASANPDGYWYLIASSPWNNQYYAVANTFMNGDPWNGPYTHNTDFNVPNC
jgi:surface antigen